MALGRRDQVGVLAGHPDRQGPVHVDGGDDVAVDLPHQHHAGDVERLGVGDAQPVAELGLLAQAGHQRADLRPPAVDDHGEDADGAHEHHILGERGQGRALAVRRPVQSIPAVFDHDDLAPEAPDVRQRLDQQRGRVLRRRLLGPAVLHDHAVFTITTSSGSHRCSRTRDRSPARRPTRSPTRDRS